jgi:hypothetical protein
MPQDFHELFALSVNITGSIGTTFSDIYFPCQELLFLTVLAECMCYILKYSVKYVGEHIHSILYVKYIIDIIIIIIITKKGKDIPVTGHGGP